MSNASFEAGIQELILQNQNPSIGSRLIFGTVDDDLGVAATGGPTESMGNPDPFTPGAQIVGGLGAELGTPDPVGVFAGLAGFNDMRIISEPIGLPLLTGWPANGIVSIAMGSAGSSSIPAGEQSVLHQFIAAMAAGVGAPMGTIATSISHNEAEVGQVRLAASLRS